MKCKEQFSKKRAYKKILIIWNTTHKYLYCVFSKKKKKPILWLKYEIYAYTSQQIHILHWEFTLHIGFSIVASCERGQITFSNRVDLDGVD